jgi:hypothetical protein
MATSLFTAPASMGMLMSHRGRGPTKPISDHELINDVGTGSGTGFQVIYNYPINPGNSRLFPRLAALADTFEKYRFTKFVVKYLPAPGSGTQTPGIVGQYLDYDPDDSAVTNITQLMQNETACVSAPWVPNAISLDTAENAQKWYYTQQTYTNSSDAAARQANQADWYFCTDKVPANTTLGIIEIDYTIQFKSAKTPAPLVMSATTNTTSGSVTGSTTFELGMSPYLVRGFTPCLSTPLAPDDSKLNANGYSANNNVWYAHSVPAYVFVTTYGNITVTSGTTWALKYNWLSTTNILSTFTLASGTGTGTTQNLAGSYYGANAGLALTGSFSLTLGGTSTYTWSSPIFVVSSSGTVNVGLNKDHPGEAKTIDPVTFSLPEQANLLDAWLATLPECSLVCNPSPIPAKDTIDTIKSEVDALNRRLATVALDEPILLRKPIKIKQS